MVHPREAMRFSHYFEIARTEEDDWFDPVLTADTQLFVDPFRVYVDGDERWARAHAKLVDFFNLTLELVAKSGLNTASAHWGAARRLLTFPEPPEFCLGYGVEPFGLGTGEGFGADMLEGASIAVRNALTEVTHFEELTLFAPGIAEDRISDIVCNVLKEDFVAYTQEICERHQIEMREVRVPHASWSRRFERWDDAVEVLPANPWWPDIGVLLVPARFLRTLPTFQPDEFWDHTWLNHSSELRSDFNYNLGKNVNARVISALARAHPSFVGEYLDHLEEVGAKPPYDLEHDPEGEVKWYDAGLKLAAEAGGAQPPRDADEFCDWVEGVLRGFAHNVQSQDGWLLLWTKDETGRLKPGTERYAQALLRTAIFQLCRVFDVDFSGEPNAGRGPVDFKLSRGWDMRALIEMKRTNNSRFWHGIAAQLPEYMAAEQVNCGYFVVLGYRDLDFTEERMNLVRAAVAAAEAQTGYRLRPIFVDARTKTSASRR
jgi:hypothetical protein